MAAADFLSNLTPAEIAPMETKEISSRPMGGFDFFAPIKRFFSNVVGVVVAVVVLLATIAAPTVMLPTLAAYGAFKFADTIFAEDEATKKKTAEGFPVWLVLLLIAAVGFFIAKKKKLI